MELGTEIVSQHDQFRIGVAAKAIFLRAFRNTSQLRPQCSTSTTTTAQFHSFLELLARFSMPECGLTAHADSLSFR